MDETATLQGKVTLDAGGWYRGLRAIKASLANYGKAMGEAFGKLKTGAMLAGAAAIAGLGLAARSAQQYGDEIAKASQATGKSTEELSGLRYAAEASGAAWSDLVAGIARANKTRPGKSLEAIADELGGIADPADRAREAMEIFGKDLAGKLLPMLNQGSKGIAALKARAADLGLIVTPEQGAAAERFGDAVTDLKLSIFGLVRQFLDFGNVTAIIERVTGAIISFRKSATFNQLRQSVADTANQFLDMGARILATWESLDGGTRAALLSMAGTLAGFGAAWYLGLVQPIIVGGAKAAVAWALTAKGIAGTVVALGAFLLGYQIGKALEESMNLSGTLLKTKTFYEKMVLMAVDAGMGLGIVAKEISRQMVNVRLGKEFDGTDLKNRVRETMDDLLNTWEDGQKEMAAVDAVADPAKSLGEAFSDAFSVEGLKRTIDEAMGALKGLVPDATMGALDDLLKKWREAAGVKFPRLPENAAAKEAADDAEREALARKEMRAAEAPFRGITKLLPGLGGAGAAMNRFVPQLPRPMNTENPRLLALAEKQLEAEKASADWLARMNANAIRVGVWQ